MRKPKYQTIRDELLRRIKEGIYASGGKLPTEKELAAEFAVNRHTVRQSLELLREAKLIMRSPKVGSLVLFGLERPPPPKTTTLLFRFLVNKGPLSEYCAQRKTVFERVAQGFMERHSWVKVKVEAVPSSSGTLMSHSPELFASDTPTVVNLNYHADDARLGKLLPLDVFPDMADAFASVEGRLLYRTLDAAGERHFHAMPLELAGWMMLADMELLGKLGFSADAIPVTWDGFLKLCAAIRRRRGAAGVYPLEKELLYGRMSMTRFLPYIYMAGDGAPVLDEAGRINISTPACARFLEWLSAVYAHAGSATDLSKGSLVRNGKAAFCLSLSGAPERGGLLPVPLPLPGAKARPRTVLHGGFVAIAAQSVKSDAEKEAAWLFVKHLVSREAQATLCQELGMIPARCGMYSEIQAAGRHLAEFYNYASRHGMGAFDVPRNDDVHHAIQNAFIRAVTGKRSVAQALAEAQAILDDYILPDTPFQTAEIAGRF